jgi:NADPH:quinone reductase-like Zn-dependent oxidoreductase
VTTVQAAYIDRLGGPETIRYGRLPAPVPGPGEVLVHVRATTVNHVDTFVRAGLFRTALTFPFVIGRDLAGTVVATGAETTGFRPGQPVWCNSMGHDGRSGAAAELVAVPADRLYPLPDGVSPDDAVAVAHPAATAYLALFTHGGLRANEVVVIVGGAGNVGSAMVTMAAEAGARVVTTASTADIGYCREIGAADVLDYRDPGLAGRLGAACPDGAALYVDPAGVNDLETAVGLLAPGGRIVLLAGARSRPVLPVGPLYQRDCAIRGFVISHATTAELAEAAGEVGRLLAAGVLRSRRIDPLPLSAAADAHRMVEAGLTRGRRLVLRSPAG